MKRTGFYFSDGQDVLAQSGIEQEIRHALEAYFVRVLGRPRKEVDELIDQELSRAIAKSILPELRNNNVPFVGQSVLDMGAGLGALSQELKLAGADVVSVEPGEVWRGIARRRIGTADSKVVAAVGERLPFKENTFDLIISLWVLEHVQDPDAVLRECFRVCRPGGFFFFTCENYLSFREKHYGIFWLPLMPAFLAHPYLRLRGRSPSFLKEAVTYTTSMSIARGVRNAGFGLLRERQILSRLDRIETIAHPWKRRVAIGAKMIVGNRLVQAVLTLERLRKTFTAGIEYWLYKPPFSRTGEHESSSRQ